MKGMLTGPVTILNWSFPREDISIEESMMQIAFVIRDEVLDLEKNGIRMIRLMRQLFAKNCRFVNRIGTRNIWILQSLLFVSRTAG